MSDPLFTVLMPTHNRADVVGFAIDSVLRQTVDDFELLVVGDGCTDDTATVVQAFDDARVTWLDLPKAPHFGYANRNVAMQSARGRYVAYAAHDDILFADHLERMTVFLRDHNKSWAYSQPLWVSADGVMAPAPGDLRNPIVAREFQRRNHIAMSSVAHTRELFDGAGGWPEDVAAAGDWHLWKRMIEHAGHAGIGYLRTPTTFHFVASWKSRRDSGSPELAAALALADASSWWPKALVLDANEGETLQAAALKALGLCDRHFAADVREACAAVIDHLATDMLRDLLPTVMAAVGRRHAEAAPSRSRHEAASLVRDLGFELMTNLAALQKDSHAASVARAALGVPPVTPPEGDDPAAVIARSGLFDAAYYLETNPDVVAAGIDPLEHFCVQGWREGRRPNRYFDVALYLEWRPDLLEADVNPLLHFLQSRG